MTIRVLVVDDQRIVRAGFRAMLDAHDDIDVVGEAADGHEAGDAKRPAAPRRRADGHPHAGHGWPGGHPAHRRCPRRRAPAAGAGTHHVRSRRVRVRRAARRRERVLLKDATEQELLTAVRVVAAGDALLAPSVTRRLIADYARRPSPRRSNAAGVERLTPRETEILTLVAQGMSNAEYLVVTEQTVKTMSAGS